MKCDSFVWIVSYLWDLYVACVFVVNFIKKVCNLSTLPAVVGRSSGYVGPVKTDAWSTCSDYLKETVLGMPPKRHSRGSTMDGKHYSAISFFKFKTKAQFGTKVVV